MRGLLTVFLSFRRLSLYVDIAEEGHSVTIIRALSPRHSSRGGGITPGLEAQFDGVGECGVVADGLLHPLPCHGASLRMLQLYHQITIFISHLQSQTPPRIITQNIN